MGVVGLTRLLQEEGWLPPPSPTTTSLWCNHDPLIIGPDVASRIQTIPPQSTLALDGSSLAFYLHRVAYKRHVDSLDSKALTPSQKATFLLPHCMPLSLLHDITKEFVSALQQELVLKVYWDGPTRRLKSETTQKRTAARNKEWSALQHYCHSGVLPSSKDWLNQFPYSSLFIHQIRYTLRQQKVQMEYCTEEADAAVARASAMNPNTFSVGNDSDYCLYANCKYIPLDTLACSGNGVRGVVITRRELADHFNLSDSDALVELALIMGNDHVSNAALLDDVPKTRNVNDKIVWLQQAQAGYRVTCSMPQVQLALDFSRALYALQNVSDYPLDNTNEQGENQAVPLFQQMHSPRTTLKPTDMSIRAVVCHELQEYLNQEQFCNAEDDNKEEVFVQEHLDAYENMFASRTQRIIQQRPPWNHVVAAFVIERRLARILHSNCNAPVVRLTSPSDLFNHLTFYAALESDSDINNNNNMTKQVVSPQQQQGSGPQQLPIDDYKETILETIKRQRVTIIQGETGCGKSSRVPAMILRAPPPDASMASVKLFISQPRRIAAKSLVERVRSCEPDLKDAIALRMGHGVREYETPRTRAWFVTTGYLVRLLANHPEKFNGLSHLVIDEVHERSVDTDILCLLCRRLLQSNHKIRLILMSATMAAALYQEYFGLPEPPIFVGARRFPIQEYFVEDLTKALPPLPPRITSAVKAITAECERSRCGDAPPPHFMEKLHQLAVHVTMSVGLPGSSVLIFVSGMIDIVSITDMIESVYVPGIRYTCFPIHSDVPFEEQLAAFDPPSADEVKVVIATNAAESSVTLPNVDHVICLGLCKQIVYNPRSHRQALQPCWISRASAVQRAGRTGRVRAGNVYRLYTRIAMEDYMTEFEPGEMVRIPLDSVILTLKELLKEKATPALLQCLEPPDMTTIDRSFKSLCHSNFITEPNDSGDITSLGSFVIALGIDLVLGSLIGLGIQFGVAAEAVEMAAILSFPKTPWIMTNPLYHQARDYNDLTARTFVSKCHFDAGVKSEPLASMNMMWDYEKVSNKRGWCRHYSLSAQRVRRIVATRDSIRSRVADFIGIDSTLLHVKDPPVRMHHAKLTILRLLQVWVFSEGIIECPPLLNKKNSEYITLSLGGAAVNEEHLSQVLSSERHPYNLKGLRDIEHFGSFTPVEGPLCISDFLNIFLVDFESRFVSFAIENKFDMFWCKTDDSLRIYALSHVAESIEFALVRDQVLKGFEETTIIGEQSASNNRRGRRGRACGLWSIRSEEEPGSEEGPRVSLVKWYSSKASRVKKVRTLKRILRQISEVNSVVSCAFSNYSKQQESPHFNLSVHGECSLVSATDIADLFATPYVQVQVRQPSNFPQTITFPDTPTTPLPDYDGTKGSDKSTADNCEGSSWNRPLLHDIPEGARLLSVLASGRRKEHLIRLAAIGSDEDDEQFTGFDIDDSPLDVSLSRAETKISQRWKQFGTDNGVFVEENSVPSAAVCMKGEMQLYACCANTLELRGGAVKAEGITLLPPGKLFVLLSLLSFGLQTPGFAVESEEKKEETDEIDPVTAKLLHWLRPTDPNQHGDEDNSSEDEKELDALFRIHRARAFHNSCEELGEALVCYPEKIKSLLEIFDTVDGYRAVPWDNLNDDPFTLTNMKKWKDAYQRQRTRTIRRSTENEQSAFDQIRPTTKERTGRRTKKKEAVKSKALLVAVLLESFSNEVMLASSRLFAVKLPEGESVSEAELASTNILCLLLQRYCSTILERGLLPEDRHTMEEHGKVSLDERHWNVYRVEDAKGKEWFMAEFVNSVMPFLSLRGRGKSLSRWITAGQSRPSSVDDALACVPPQFSTIDILQERVSFLGGEEPVILFDSVETSLRMEAAFWLERQFGESLNRHWYQQTLDELMDKALRSLPVS